MDNSPLRVLRGGSWFYAPVDARVAYRLRFAPFYRNFYLGVRLVRWIGVLEQLADVKDAK